MASKRVKKCNVLIPIEVPYNVSMGELREFLGNQVSQWEEGIQIEDELQFIRVRKILISSF